MCSTTELYKFTYQSEKNVSPPTHSLLLLVIHLSTEVAFSTWNLYSIAPLLWALNPFLEAHLQHTFTRSINRPLHSQLLNVYFIFYSVVPKMAHCVKKLSLSDNSIKIPLLLCPSHCRLHLATLHAGVGPRNALYTRTQGAVNKISSDVPLSGRLQSKTAWLFYTLCKWFNIQYCCTSEEKEGKKHTSASEFEACVAQEQYFKRDHYHKPVREVLMEKGMQ